jgi:enoyl-CoA hydratase
MTETVRYALDAHVATLTLARSAKRNAFDLTMLRELADAYTRAEDDPEVRVLLVLAEGAHFTAGLDLGEVGPAVASGAALFPAGGVDPLGLYGRRRTKPVVMGIRGYCLTIGIELALASDVILAADDARFGQIEIKRGIFPFGGATLRLPARAGWHDAMRWLLTGDLFDAKEAHRIGLVQEITAPDALDQKARAIADSIAKAAPLGVMATLKNAWIAEAEGPDAAARALLEQARALMGSEDAAEGMLSFIERRDGRFRGR